MSRTTIATHRGTMPHQLAIVLMLAGSLGACTPSVTPDAPATPPGASNHPTASPAGPAPTATAAAATPAFARNPAEFVEGAPYLQAIDPAAFVEGVDHPFFPLAVGTRWVFGGAERIEVEVLPPDKVILGVAVTVVRDRVFDADTGDLVEDTLDWYAQDVDGNVWYFGEETAEYEGGQVVSTAGSWEAGVDGAQPGIIMLAQPRVGDLYRQEFYAGEAEDLAEVTAVDGSITVGAGTWSGGDVLVTEEWTPLEPGVRERKTYARGIGLVEVRAILGGDDVTTLTSSTSG